MDKNLRDKILAALEFYANGNLTVKEAALRFGVSERTFQLWKNKKAGDAILSVIEELNERKQEKIKSLYNKDAKEQERILREITLIEKDIERYKNLPKDIALVETRIKAIGNQKGGEKGKRFALIPQEKLEEIYQVLLNSFKGGDAYSLDDLESIYGIPSSTLYENLKKMPEEKREIIQGIFDYNRTEGKKRK